MTVGHTQLSDLFTIHKGHKPGDVFGEPVPGARRLLQINDLRGEGPLRYTSDKTGTSVTTEDIVVAWDGANAGTVGFGLEGTAGSTLAVLRPVSDAVFAPYAGRYLQSRFTSLNRATDGAAVPHLNRRLLESMVIPLPSLAEQRRIAAVLDKADWIRRKRRDLRLLDEFLKSAYTAVVGQRNPEYSNWPQWAVSDLGDGPGSMRTGPFGSALRHSEFGDSGVAVLGIDNAVQNRFAWAERRFITPEKYEKFKRYTVKPGDVIVTIMGTTGRSAVVPEDVPLAISTKHLAVITVDQERVHPLFLSHALHTDPAVLAQISGANRGAIMAGLNLGIIKRLRLRLPPMAAQQRFAAVVERVSQTRDRLLMASTETEGLFDSLAQRAFQGDL